MGFVSVHAINVAILYTTRRRKRIHHSLKYVIFHTVFVCVCKLNDILMLVPPLIFFSIHEEYVLDSDLSYRNYIYSIVGHVYL